MKYIESFTDGMHINGIYLCKTRTIALTKNGKEYGNLTLQDKTGQIEGKIWDLGSPAIRDFDAMDFVEVDALVTVFNGANQLNIRRIQRADKGQYDERDYFPTTPMDIEEMKKEVHALVDTISDPYLKQLLKRFFDDEGFMHVFSLHSAAKSVHHGFIGGLLQHSLSVAKICSLMAGHYGKDMVNRDLLVTGALLHDIGKTKELSGFPTNEYTDPGQLLGHIIIGSQMIDRASAGIQGFPEKLKNELIHLILSHHGEYEFGSPKKPALIEAIILAYVDNIDAKVETMHEAFMSKQPQNQDGWLGFNKLLDSNIRKTTGV